MDDVVEIDIAPRPSCLICNDGAEFPSEEHLEDHVVNYHQTTFDKYRTTMCSVKVRVRRLNLSLCFFAFKCCVSRLSVDR